MRHLLRLLSLPPSLLLLIAIPPVVISAEPQWPYNLPAHVKYFPEDEPLIRRGLSAQEQLASQSPVGVRKMSEDDNEMFFLDYWQFEETGHDKGSPSHRRDQLWKRSIPADFTNVTSGDLLPPLLLHSDKQGHGQSLFELFARSNLYARDYQCPTGTNNCSDINHPYSCCATGETCVSVADTGLGNVGCCPQGAHCSRNVSNCDAGYTSCPGSSNGGCCIPNYTCDGVGCVSVGTSTTTVTLPVVTVTTGTQATACSSGFQSCPSSFGGGCCTNGAACGSSSCITSTSTNTATAAASTTPTATSSLNAPLLATGSGSTTVTDTSDVAIPSTLTTGTSLIAVCPSNFYFCSAYYRPGCCRIGRDCATTDCPAAASSSTIVSNGVTILIPVGASTGGTSYVTTALITGAVTAVSSFKAGSCAGGWSSCDANVGGGCCPPNYGCGTVCTATGGGATGVVSKVAPSRASSYEAEILGFIWVGFGIILGAGMMIL